MRESTGVPAMNASDYEAWLAEEPNARDKRHRETQEWIDAMLSHDHHARELPHASSTRCKHKLTPHQCTSTKCAQTRTTSRLWLPPGPD